MYKPFFKTNIHKHETERLLLRGFTEKDLGAYYQILGNPAVAKWLGSNEGFSKQECQQWIGGMLFWWDKHGYGPWAVVEKTSGKLIGHCGLKFAEEFGDTELMYAIHPDFCGKGYATEASAFALRFGFQEKNIEKIIAYTLPANKASVSVLQKLEMIEVGIIKHGNLDHVLFEKRS